MSTLTFLHHDIPSADLGGECELPAWNQIRPPMTMESELDEDDGLFLNYGQVACCHPYREQNAYDHTLRRRPMLWAVLENEHLRAAFAPTMGGKLWSLYDKDAGRELLFANPVNKPCNLAIRNAWTSGGVEWNCGFVGHHPHTCDTMFTAQLQAPDGTPVLRMYQYERVRGVVYQMDFSLPDGSPVLVCRMRIVNPADTVTPMYWWSNIAVPQVEGGRVVVPAHATYTNIHGTVIKVPIPVPDYSHIKVQLPPTAGAFDVTYPQNTPVSIDYFWKLDPTPRPFTCQLGPDGYGLFQASTARLKGRKLFVWGQGPGGEHWQQFLSGEGCDGRYVEIQAGLAASQYETLPMPPHTAWEWVEVYGALHADASRVHGAWDEAIAEVSGCIDRVADAARLEKYLRDTRALALQPAQQVVVYGEGWGALEEARRAAQGLAPLAPHLDMGAIGPQQAPWEQLLRTGALPAADPHTAPVSWMVRPEWEQLLRTAAATAPDWQVWCQLAGMRLAAADAAGAKELFQASLAAAHNAWALYGLSCCALLEGDASAARAAALQAFDARPASTALALHALRLLFEGKCWQQILELEKRLGDEAAARPRARQIIAYACVHTGALQRARDILWADGGLEVPDVREGEISLTDLWYDLEEAAAAAEGRAFDRASARPPRQFDFRMFAAKPAGEEQQA